MALCDSVLLLAVTGAALVLVHEGQWSSVLTAAPQFSLIILVAIPLLASQGLYRAIIRFVGEEMILGVTRGVLLIAVVVGLVDYLLIGPLVRSISAALVFSAFGILGLTASRLVMRTLVSGRQRRGERVAIYGAGEAGMRLAAAMAAGRSWYPVLFIDDSSALRGRVVAGLPVCSAEGLPELVGALRIRRVLLAMPSASRRKRHQIIASLERLPVRVQTVPDIGDLVSGKARVDDVRDVDVVDLLGRESVPPNAKLLGACIAGKSVMVTGAGGSIGSELCRQIVNLKPVRLVLLDVSEPALFEIDLELRRMHRG